MQRLAALLAPTIVHAMSHALTRCLSGRDRTPEAWPDLDLRSARILVLRIIGCDPDACQPSARAAAGA